MYMLLLFFIPTIFAAWSPAVGTKVGAYSSPFGVASWGPNRFDLFVRGTDRSLYHRAFGKGAWGNWQNLGGVLTSKPTAVSWKKGTVAAFVRGADNGVWVRWYDSQWKPWASLGGVIWGAPTVCASGPKRIDMFAVGIRDRFLWKRTWTGGAHNQWTKWRPFIGVKLNSNPSCVSWGDNRIDVFAQDTNGFLIQLTRHAKTKRWGTWRKHEKVPFSANPIVASKGPRLLNVFIRRPDDKLMVKSYNYMFWTRFWTIPKLKSAWDPAVVSPEKGKLRMMMIQSDGVQYHSDWTNPMICKEEITEVGKDAPKMEDMVADVEVAKMEVADINNVEVEDIDNAEVEDIDNAEVEDIDNAEVEDIDNAEVEDIDNAEVEDIDNAEIEDIENAEVEDILDAEVEDIENAEVEDIDKVEGENVDNAEIEDIDKVEGENVDNAEVEKVELAQTENVDKAN